MAADPENRVVYVCPRGCRSEPPEVIGYGDVLVCSICGTPLKEKT